HMSIKLTQIGLDVDPEFCYENLREILLKAHECGNMHINMDTEDYNHTVQTFEMLDRLKGEFKNVGTVIQGYLYEADTLVEKYPELRLRMVKGAYKESDTIAYQTKEDIDENYIRLIEKRLLNAKNVTSIATHDDKVITHIKQFIKDNNIEKNQYEFQMLYGFRTDLAEKIAGEGNNFCIYVPYGDDWFSYFMRRLAERPQNLNLMFKELMKPEVMKKAGVVTGIVAAFGAASALVYRLFKK
ncbi:MAG: proline dehydrogenase family protein, partial [Staphylococcus equorum]|nr:proline dehydrogenase family protein [Staphylococcus equorum]